MNNIVQGLEHIAELLDPKGYSHDPKEMEPWLTDWRGRYTGTASALISPENVQQLSQIIKICGTHQIPIVPQGGNSGMVAGATPDNSGNAIILSMRRMNNIDYNLQNPNHIRCEAGVILQNLHDESMRYGKRFPLTLGGKGSATVGGLVSTNAGGTQVLRHGNMRSLVAGVEAVLPNGDIFDGMSVLKKDNRGYDINQLLIGAEGTLGIITAAKLRLVTNILDRKAIWVAVQNPSDAYELLLHMEDQCARQLEGYELMSEKSIHKVLQYIPNTRRPLSKVYPWYVLIELIKDGDDQIALQELAEKALISPLNKGLILDAAFSSNEKQVEEFWKLRDSISEAERAAGPAFQHDISVPIPKMPHFIDTISPQIEKEFNGCEVIAFGHMGDGNIHYHVKAPKGISSQDWIEQEANVNKAVYDAVTAYGGSISAEHGIGQSKRSELARLSSDARIFALRAIKKAFDPHNIMNPGKLIP